MAETTIFNRSGLPRATVTHEDDGTFSCVVDEIEGLSPTRSPSAEEMTAGIQLLDPPTVTGVTALELVENACAAVSEAIDSTDRASTPAEYVQILLRTGIAVRGAIRALRQPGVSI